MSDTPALAPAWNELWTRKTTLSPDEVLRVSNLVTVAMQNDLGELMLTASSATCAGISKWAKEQGFRATIIDIPLPGYSAFEAVPDRHLNSVNVSWIRSTADTEEGPSS